MHASEKQSLARVDRTYRERVVTARHARRAPVELATWDVPGEPVPWSEVDHAAFAPAGVGTPWGRPWGTTWLRVEGEVPADWPGDVACELVLDLGFSAAHPGFQAEGLAHDEDGRVLKGVEPRNRHVPVSAAPGSAYRVHVEMAGNPDLGDGWSFRPTPLGDLATAGDAPLYALGVVELVQRDAEVVALDADWRVLRGLVDVLPAESERRARVVQGLERAVDVLDPGAGDVGERASAARAVLAPLLAAPAAASAHHVSAVGHAHIDSAWLWPTRETARKCARTFSNVLHLMDTDPDVVFVASSAQQYAWVQRDHPELFDRIAARVAEGRWVPVGGMWVESDTNLPGGEALVRQFVLARGFFERELGVPADGTDTVWLPDSFGYSAALPQLALGAGAGSFLTQKLSWNDTNRFPHSTFAWEGLDGSRILTHFPPVDTYNSDLGAADLARAAGQHRERGRSDASLVPFGWGNGGGGPTREMVEVARRAGDLEGSPRVVVERPDAFFDRLRALDPEPPVWSGELYLEFHRGTYTSQTRTKLGNRRCEHLLREAELWATTATVRTGAAYPAEALRAAWETVLLQQFHDILPGSSIAWVHQEAERRYAEVERALEDLVAAALGALGCGAGPDGLQEPGGVLANAAPVPVAGVAALSVGVPVAPAAVTVTEQDGGAVLESASLRAVLDRAGHLVSLVDTTGREAIAPDGAGNVLELFGDVPNRWDAWDVDAAYRRVPRGATDRPADLRVDGALVHVTRSVGGVDVRQVVQLSPDGTALDLETTVDWRQQQQLLKLAFALDVHAETSASEIQFGHVRRALHVNTSWDAARFEISGHRWVRVEEPGFGVTLANDRVYGRDAWRTTRPGGGTTTVVRESLLRAPRFPDPGADLGEHTFRHRLVPGDLAAGIAAGYELNCAPRRLSGAAVEPLVTVDGEGVLVEAVKLAEDGSGDVVVRLYEAHGRQARCRVSPGFPLTGDAVCTDLLERATGDPLGPGPWDLRLRAFEVRTLRLPR